MFLHALATALPPASFTQPECWDIVERSGVRSRLHRRTMLTLHSILRGDHGIERRHFAAEGVGRIFDRTSDELNHSFHAQAPALAGRALTAALERAGVRPAELDALLICPCT